jgi:undecaprenyl diphosphate synthase
MSNNKAVPEHIAVVMDGNGRWAKKRNLPTAAGHKAGVETVRTVLEASKAAGVKCLTLFAFSSENWTRPKLEVSALMKLFSSYLDSEVKALDEKGVQLRFIGRRDRFSKTLLKKIEQAEKITAHNDEFHLNLAVDFGGQWDITQACRTLAKKAASGEIQADNIDEALLQSELCLADLPMPDLLIRTSGEYRISNFLLWQLAYAEMVFTDVLWPDFTKAELLKALEDFAGRDRRFGGRKINA